jgi:prepilin-type N-terminal cleavage/methylation domain-containing protein
VRRDSGFTLPETLVATTIVVSAIAGIAWTFSLSVAANLANRHRAVAALVAGAKMEECLSLPLWDPRWTAGGALDPDAPAAGYVDRVTVDDTTYLRLWRITAGATRTIDVAVYAPPSRLPGQRASAELARLSTTRAPGF